LTVHWTASLTEEKKEKYTKKIIGIVFSTYGEALLMLLV
jgi:hypothetical protein